MIKKIAYCVYCSACVIALAWLLFSWLDIVSDNNSPQPAHSKHNVFILVEEAAH